MSEPYTIDLSRRTLQSQVTQRLRDEIVGGAFPAGEKMNEAALAAAFGTSRGTVREALRKLEQQGLLRSIPHRGTFVRKLDADEIVHIYQVRAALESVAARAAAALADAAAIQAIEERLTAIREVADRRGGFRERVQADLAFHEAICIASRNEILVQLWQSLVDRITAMMMSVGSEPIQALQKVESHAELLESIRRADPTEITSVFEEHFARSAAAAAARIDANLAERGRPGR
jgi:DNA-binding GntR family transcriptional regulator